MWCKDGRGRRMTREEKQKAINTLKKSAPVMSLTQEEFNNYIQTINKVIDWLEQETVSRESYEHEYFLRKEFEIKIDKLQRQLKKQTMQVDKIKAEIEKAVWEDVIISPDGTDEIRIPLLEPDDVFEIIDKYKVESEEE